MAGLAGSYLAARSFRYGGWVLRLVLAGIAVSALLSAGVGALKLAADPLGELPELTFWLLGGLWRASWRDVLAVLPAIAAGLGVTLALRGRLDVLSLDDRVAHSLGAAPSRERLLLLLAATLATAAAVSLSGLVGWIGLMAPHAARRLFGASSRRALPGRRAARAPRPCSRATPSPARCFPPRFPSASSPRSSARASSSA